MGYNRDSLWRIYQIGGADLALRYADIAERSSRTSSSSRAHATRSEPAAVRKFKVLGVRFYAEDFGIVGAWSERTFAQRFPARGTWRICFEATIENPWHYTASECDLVARCYGPDGRPLDDVRQRFEVTPDHRTYRYANGWMPPSLGRWDAGLYRVEVAVDGGEPATETFTVYTDGPTALLDNPFIRPRRRV
jgi:hypothetical protein